MSARNTTLARANAAVVSRRGGAPDGAAVDPPLWILGHAGWYQEAWIARNVQRQRGTAADPARPRLASVESMADTWYDPAAASRSERWALDLPDLDATRRYLADTLEVTLELLAHAADDDDGLYFYRRAVLHEAMQAESLVRSAQALGVTLALPDEPAPSAVRAPLAFPATRWRLGREIGGCVLDNEKWAHEVSLPPFDIDAQPVTWSQYAEFVEDGGYDEPRWWSPEGLSWLGREGGRRTPRHVEQVRRGVLQRRFGRLVRVGGTRAAVHVTAFEAEAWCRWAGRRLPTEVEWEAAAHLGASRGFRWGEVWEWTCTTLHPYPGFAPDPDRSYTMPSIGCDRVLRGASFATPSVLRDPKLRHFAPADDDDGFHGFRSCAP
jgi:gamma-glutamyl hercynylcysteine S-oxide synthase